jgi:hypothetical protein
MTDQIIYATFPDKEQAISLIALLQDANIEYEIDESSSLFKALASDQPIFDRIKIKIKASDVERVDTLIEQDNETASVEHFLYTFSDEDLLDVLKNPSDWTPKELELVNKIINERQISLIATKKPEYREDGRDKKSNETTDEKTKLKTSSLLAIVGLCSLIYIYQAQTGVIYFSRILEFFMSSSCYYISEEYHLAYGVLLSLFILTIAAFVYIKHKWALFFAVIIFMYDTYLYINCYDEFVLGFFRGAMSIGLLMELQSPKIDEES